MIMALEYFYTISAIMWCMCFWKILSFTNHALKRSGKNRVVQVVQNLYSFLSRALIKATIVLIIKA